MIRTYNWLLLKSLANRHGPAKAMNLLRHYLAYPQSRYALTSNINITQRCNLSCAFCAYGHNDREKVDAAEMSIETFTRVLDLEALKHALIINLGSGEVLLHGEIFRFIRMIQERGKVASIVSNGTTIMKNLDQLVETPPDFMWVSMYDNLEERQLAAVQEVVAKRRKSPVIGISKIITKKNIDDAERICKAALEVKADFCFLQNLYPMNPGDDEHLILETDKDILAGFRDLKKRYRKLGLDVLPPGSVSVFPKPKYTCLSLYKGLMIEPNGALQPCCFIYPDEQETYGNILKDPDAYHTNPNLIAMRKALLEGKLPGPCKKCYVINAV